MWGFDVFTAVSMNMREAGTSKPLVPTYQTTSQKTIILNFSSYIYTYKQVNKNRNLHED
jgi:hypothetical protein